ncbi:hypothetical protein [Spirosoma endophyticum]|uniref:Lipoprotein n=1 Tax=Spirosoma endophyticum TaxID=662367 RepID=A0A1I2GTJ5_9BACT|nr:hypothetical protein [Spirosoma endophyticum]SFF20503.1 hypothetical protein SAMN05216167_13513 [Spirosoma endophyticum]
MSIHIKPIICYILALFTTLGCSADKLNLPEPAELVVGNYEAIDPGALLTLKGDRITLTVKRVTAELVDIKMQAFLNNQLVDSIRHERANVVLNVAQTSVKTGCVSPFVKLASSGQLEELRSNCSEQGILTYTYGYIPAGQQAAALINVKFKSL